MAQILDNQCSKSCDTLNKRKTSNTLFDIILKSKCYPLSYIILLPLQTPSPLVEPKIQLAQDGGDRGGKVCTIISGKPARALLDFHSMRQPGQYYLPPPPPPPDKMSVHHKVSFQHFIRLPWQFISIQLYSLVEEGTVRVNCFSKNTMQWPY